ncbi:hypothetical protein Aph02nite_25480 [Actinoplanes philippinensis]|uniref:Uncharacterized protein n=1 Tax=Actinoplanes philippinensis TaxID=35752 RepID=A0A1I2G3W7_9ACTN|nr:hypothetical protein [Actinoplanes philippinensis]GIE76598.1 hypothetical protein Aph02nite_25480 [Actinoplanes philippinensis]SFF12325.1 hypothetical protein SAMN05421541_106205 [Actinoplanes philippinensis]
MTVTTGSALLERTLRHFGVSLGHLTERSAEAWIRALRLPTAAQACTHPAELPFPHVAISVALPAGLALPAEVAGTAFMQAAIAAGSAHAAGRSGRAIHYRGWSAITGDVTVGEIFSQTDIVRVIARDTPADTGDVLAAGRGLTPHWIAGDLTVLAEPRPDGVLVPLPGFTR